VPRSAKRGRPLVSLFAKSRALVRPASMGTGEETASRPRPRFRPDASAGVPVRGAPAADDEQQPRVGVLLLDERESAASPNRVLADTSLSSGAAV
jgi:hypothetical protein